MKNFTLIALLLFGFTLNAQNIESIKINSIEYGDGNSIGFHILGDGIGLTWRKALKNEDQLEAAVSYWAQVLIDENYESIEEYYHGVNIRPAYNFYLGSKVKIKKNKQKIKKHYLSLKPGVGFSKYSAVSGALTWHKERFFLDNPNRSTSLDLGISGNHLFDKNNEIKNDNYVGIFIRIGWNWFR